MRLVISIPAKSDIESILDYTFGQWGIRQMFKYEQLINDGLNTIKQYPLSPFSKNVEHKKISTRYLRVGKHHIYHTIEIDLIIIFRVLHGQMNPDLHR